MSPAKMGPPMGNKNGEGNSKYKPEYCEQAVCMGRKGMSMMQMCSQWDIGRTTIDRWAENNDLFRDALARARVHSQSFHEQQGEDNIKNRDFNAQLWIRKMQARFRDDYTERQQLDHSGNVSVLFSKDDEGLL